MPTLEQVEELRKKMNVSYAEAKEALEASDNDVLDAIIYLEEKGHKTGPSGGNYSTKDNKNSKSSKSHEKANTHTTYTTTTEGNFSHAVNSFFIWIGKTVKRGNENFFNIINQDKTVLSIPLTAFILLLAFCFWFVLPALIVGMFCGLRYTFTGRDFKNSKANDFIDSAQQAADDVKSEFQGKKENKEDTQERE